MPFIRQRGVKGLVYVPESAAPRKHPCPDCGFCQQCGESRCRLCVKRAVCVKPLRRKRPHA